MACPTRKVPAINIQNERKEICDSAHSNRVYVRWNEASKEGKSENFERKEDNR